MYTPYKLNSEPTSETNTFEDTRNKAKSIFWDLLIYVPLAVLAYQRIKKIK